MGEVVQDVADVAAQRKQLDSWTLAPEARRTRKMTTDIPEVQELARKLGTECLGA